MDDENLVDKDAGLPYTMEHITALADALHALAKISPEVVATLSEALRDAKGGRQPQMARDCMRAAARLLVPTDRVHAKTLYGLAEVLDYAIERIERTQDKGL